MNAADEVAQVVGSYIQSFHRGDGALAQEVFAPEAHLHGIEKGKLALMPRDAYADYLTRSGPLPEALQELGRPLAITVHTPDLASAVVEVWGKSRRYTDLLSLMKIDGSWRIVAKVYSWTATERTAVA